MSKILAISPSRISLLGGSSDLKQYYEKYGGLCLNFAIDIYQKFTMYEGDDLWNNLATNSVPYGGSQEFIFKVLNHYKIGSMHHTKFTSEYDGLIGSGLGSSASALVAIIAAISKRLNLNYSKWDIVKAAYELSPNFGGIQDQLAAVYGGANLFRLQKDETFIRKIDISRVLPSILLFSTKIERQNRKIQDKLKELDQTQIDNIHELKNLVYDGLEAIEKGDIKTLGRLLDKAWIYKKAVNKDVTNKHIDNFYNKAKQFGAFGGKLLGSGSGGYMIFIVDPKDRVNFVKNMETEGMENWDYNLCTQGVTTRILPR